MFTGEPKTPPKSKSQLAYELREQDPSMSWADIGNAVGLRGGRNAMKAAKAHALRTGSEWPVPGGREVKGAEARKVWWQEDTTGERAYLMRKEKGLPWAEIGEQLSASTSSISVLALRYARSRGLPWPLPSKTRHENTLVGERAYLLRKDEELTWEEIAADLDTTPERAKRLALAHRKKNDLPPVAKPTRAQRFGPVCYQLRMEGLTWNEVAARAGMKWNTHACTAAKKHALANNLPWPPSFNKD